MKKDEIKELMEFFENIGIAKMKIKEGNFELELEKSVKSPKEDICPPPPVSQIQPIEIVTREFKEKDKSKDSIKSPMVGTFYVAPSPGATPYIKVGDSVKKGEIIGIIEAMKIMNEIEAEFDCRIVEALVDDGQPVEYGMPLFSVEKI